MRSDWLKKELAELGRIITGKTPKTSIPENYGGAIPFLTPSDDMSVKFVKTTNRTLSELGKQEVKNCLLPANAVCVSCIGSNLGKVVMTMEPTVTNQQINSIIPDTDINADFLYYSILLLGKELNFISKTSTAVPIVNKTSFSKYSIYVPPMDKQKAIAATLSALDDKIDNNHAVNKNLEKMVQETFQSWFINFEPFQEEGFVESALGLIPNGWNVAPLSAFCSFISRGITPKYIEDGEQVVINQKCIRDHQVSFGPSRFHLPKVINEKWLQYGDVLVNSTGQGTLGRVAQWLETATNVTVDSHVSIVRPSEQQYIYYIGQFLMGKEKEIELMAAGSTGQTELSRERLGSLLLVCPKIEQLEEFSKLVEPLMIKIVSNNHENEKLAKLRDTLLPKLMSGELLIPSEGFKTNERSNDNGRTR